MSYFGYHRASTQELNLDRGITDIEDFCRKNGFNLERIYTDKHSGRDLNRIRYTVLKEDVLREGDTLILWKLDRLGRNKREIIKELQYYKEHSIRVMFIDIPTTTVDYSNMPESTSQLLMETINNILIELFSTAAETELERNRKRSDEGREAMKKRGEWDKYGRPRKMGKDDFAEQYARVTKGEIRTVDLMRELDLNHNTYYRYIRELRSV